MIIDGFEEETIEDMKGYLNQFDYGKQEDGLQLIEKLLEYFDSKRDVCQTLLNEKAETTFLSKATFIAHQYFMESGRIQIDMNGSLAEPAHFSSRDGPARSLASPFVIAVLYR